MKLTEELAHGDRRKIWNEYCGFVELNIDQYMYIQDRLLLEQLQMWRKSGIGQRILQGKQPENQKELREMVPLTSYEDYADILLRHDTDALPMPPVTWIETTWEGGKKPIKCAPYTESMLESFRKNCIAIALMASAEQYGEFELGDKCLSGLAGLPFLTGLLGLVVEQEFHFQMLPPSDTDPSMRFSERSKLGIRQAMSSGLDYVLGMGSVSYYLSNQFAKIGSGSHGGSHGSADVSALFRLMRAKVRARREKRQMMPKDFFKIRGFVVAGTDNACYKDDLEELWGVRPIELFAGTECSLIGTETWNKRDLYFFPDACFYEFIAEEDMRSSNPHLTTFTMDQVQAGKKYELVISSLKGGAFMRYRMGDVYECIGIGSEEDHSALPRFRYLDRVPDVIDIAGFTRITENSVSEAVSLSQLPITDWCAAKEFDSEHGHPYLHLYAELDLRKTVSAALSETILRHQLELYFTYLDGDYENLKKILEMEPLEITFIKSGTFRMFEEKYNRKPAKINPDHHDLLRLRALQDNE